MIVPMDSIVMGYGDGFDGLDYGTSSYRRHIRRVPKSSKNMLEIMDTSKSICILIPLILIFNIEVLLGFWMSNELFLARSLRSQELLHTSDGMILKCTA